MGAQRERVRSSKLRDRKEAKVRSSAPKLHRRGRKLVETDVACGAKGRLLRRLGRRADNAGRHAETAAWLDVDPSLGGQDGHRAENRVTVRTVCVSDFSRGRQELPRARLTCRDGATDRRGDPMGLRGLARIGPWGVEHPDHLVDRQSYFWSIPIDHLSLSIFDDGKGGPVRTPTPCTLNGRLVVLEPLSASHARDLFGSFAEDSAIWRWLPIAPPSSEREMHAGICAHLKRQDAGAVVAFAQVSVATGRAVGVTN